MTSPIIKTIVKLFSIFSNIDKNCNVEDVRPLLKFYLLHYINEDQIEEFLTIFEFYNKQYSDTETRDFYKEISLKSVKTLRLVEDINKSLVYSDKLFLITLFAELLKTKGNILPYEYDYLKTVALSFKLPEDEFADIERFIIEGCDKVTQKSNLLFVISNDTQQENADLKVIKRENLDGKICFLHIASANLFIFYYDGNDALFLNGSKIIPQKIYPFRKGNSISSYKLGFQNVKLKPVYYTELAQKFIAQYSADYVELIIDEPEFYYTNNKQGVRPFRFKTESFLFVGVIGSSGVGKSTLLNVINGNLTPQKGSIKLNGYDIHQNKDLLKGLIGYVPQDDLLFEELTVYQNLYFNAKLCFDDYSEEKISETVDNILEELDLKHIKHSKVGNPLDKQISGGQRKRVNMGLELIREPSILLVDEPTSGLSSSDSMNIMNLLREQTIKGKLVIVNIHQPSTNIFKLFDQLIVLDEGGTPVYTGDPMDGLVYFKTLDQQVQAEKKECPVCGSINPDIMLEIIEDKEVDENGKYTTKRKRSPDYWYQKFRDHIDNDAVITEEQKQIPHNPFKKPNLFKQFKIFITRNILTKLSNPQYIIISLLEAPLLALILGFFTKYTAGSGNAEHMYVFSKNVNIPSFILMSIIVAMFIGMLISAEEIIKDQKILEREKFLNLSRSSYLFSKIVFLLILSSIQIFTFVIIGNLILQIKDLNFEYWLVLFSVAFFSNLLGLNLSSGLKSQIAIYILIPFILIPHILLSGTIVKFDQLHFNLTSEIYPPVTADLMTSRWAYEALAVTQFKDNEFQKNFYPIEKKESELHYKINILIPELLSYIDEILAYTNDSKTANSNIERKSDVLQNELTNLTNKYKGFNPGVNLNMKTSDEKELNKLEMSLKNLRLHLSESLEQLLYEKDRLTDSLIEKKGGLEEYNQFKRTYHNAAIAELVKRKDNPEKIIEKNGQLIRKAEPVFNTPLLKNGRTQFYTAEKRIGDYLMDTFWFNIMVIWIFNIILYIILYYNLLKKTIYYFSNIKLSRLSV